MISNLTKSGEGNHDDGFYDSNNIIPYLYMTFVDVDRIGKLSFLSHRFAEDDTLFKEKDLELFPFKIKSWRTFTAQEGSI